MKKNLHNPSNEFTIKHHTILVIVDLTKFDMPFSYSNPNIGVILDSGLYMLLEEMRSYLEKQPKAGKKQNRLRTRINEALISLVKKRTVITTQLDTNSEIQKILTEVELGWKKIFANFFIKTKKSPDWERLITFLKEDFEDKDFDPKKAMKDALKRINMLKK